MKRERLRRDQSDFTVTSTGRPGGEGKNEGRKLKKTEEKKRKDRYHFHGHNFEPVVNPSPQDRQAGGT